MGQLPPQEADIHLHVVVLGVGVIAPHLQQQLLLGHHPALAAQQQLQHVVFPAAQPQGPLPAGQLKGPRLQPQIPEGDGGVGPGVAAAPPQQGAHAGQQLLRLKGLGEIIVRPAVQSLDPVGQVAAGRQHQHRHGMAPGAQLPQQAEPVHPRQHSVQQDQVIQVRGGVVVAGHAVAADVHGVALPPQQLRQVPGQALFILDHKQPHGAPPLIPGPTGPGSAAGPGPPRSSDKWCRHRKR